MDLLVVIFKYGLTVPFVEILVQTIERLPSVSAAVSQGVSQSLVVGGHSVSVPVTESTGGKVEEMPVDVGENHELAACRWTSLSVIRHY